MNLIKESYERLFERECSYVTELEYNRRLGPFNANIALHQHKFKVSMNLQWKDIDEEIKIGLIQHLLCRIFKSKRQTSNIELYTNFIKNIPLLTPKTKSTPLLEVSFQRMNGQFFQNSLEKPNLQWGSPSFRKLASYNFHNDTITVSTLFQDQPNHILDALLYHEMLHKHLQFKSKNGRSSFHSREFRQLERLYPNYERVEKEIAAVIRTKRPRKLHWSFLFR